MGLLSPLFQEAQSQANLRLVEVINAAPLAGWIAQRQPDIKYSRAGGKLREGLRRKISGCIGKRLWIPRIGYPGVRSKAQDVSPLSLNTLVFLPRCHGTVLIQLGHLVVGRGHRR